MKKICFTIPTELPSMNEIIDIAKHKKSKYAGYRNMKSDYDFIVRMSCPNTGFMLKHIKHMKILWVSKDRKKDKDNIRAGIKFILDGIQGKLLTKDGYKNIESFSDVFKVDKENPRVEVTIFYNKGDKI